MRTSIIACLHEYFNSEAQDCRSRPGRMRGKFQRPGTKRSRASVRSYSLGDGVLEGLAGLEDGGAGGGNGDLLAGHRVAAGALGAVPDIEAAKADIIQHTKDMFPIPRRQLKLLYKHTAYGVADINWDMEGYINSVSRFTNEDLQAFARQFYVTHNMALLVGGNINADEIAARVEKAFVDLPKGKKNKVQKDIYTGGFATIPAQQQSLFYFGFDISGIRNADLAVLIKLLNGRLERSFIGTDVLSDVRIAGYYGRRTLQISIKTQQKNIGEILDTVCRNIIRIKTKKASPRRMERSRNLAMTGYMEMFGSEIARSREVSWQIFSQGEMFDIQELMFAIPEVSARNIREAAEKIFSTPMTLVCSSDQPVDYQALCAQIRQ